jgi:hypothetical protein
MHIHIICDVQSSEQKARSVAQKLSEDLDRAQGKGVDGKPLEELEKVSERNWRRYQQVVKSWK